MNENFKFIISGSKGWLSRHFANKVNILGYSIFEIENKNMWQEAQLFASKDSKKTILIHNAFESPHINQDTNLDTYKSKLDENFVLVENLINNVNLDAIFYPSTGRVYDQNRGKSDIFDIYAKQKLFEEEQLKSFVKKYDFALIIPRIFSLIGPNNFFNSKSSFQSLISETAMRKNLKIISNTNNLHSISIMDNLIILTLSILLNRKKNELFQFDVVDSDVTLIYFSELIFQKLNLDLKNLNYNIDPKLNRKEYVGSQAEYLKLMEKYVKNPFTLENYLLFILNNQLQPSELPQFKHL